MSKNITISLLIVALIISILIIVIQVNKTKETRTPNSVVITLTEQPEQIEWNNLKLRIGQQDGPVDYVSIPNHSEITNTETINLPIGKATMIRFLHGGPAVNPVPNKIMYWIYIQKLILDKPDLMKTYYLEGEVTGNNEQIAKEELIQIAQTWKVNN